MAPPTRTPPASWIDAGLQAFGHGGPDAVRIEPLAKALGVSRGGFYWQFADRQALLDAILDAWERRSTDEVIDRVERDGGSPRQKLRRAGELTFSSALRPVDLAVRDWARRDAAVASRLARVDTSRMAYLRSQFSVFCPDHDEVQARSMLAFSLIIGNHFIAADPGTQSRDEILELAIRHLLR